MEKRFLGERALVVGAGVGGLFAAGALRHHFRQVIVLERDKLPQTVAFRKGVPQGPHGHVVLKRGENIAEDFFPGFRKALRQPGAAVACQNGLQRIVLARCQTRRLVSILSMSRVSSKPRVLKTEIRLSAVCRKHHPRSVEGQPFRSRIHARW